MGSRGGIGLSAVVAALLLGACGATGEPRTDPSGLSNQAPVADPTPDPTPDPAPEGDGELVPTNLPDVIPGLTATPKPTPPPVRRTADVFGADVSWPQCPKGMGIPQKPTQGSPMPTKAAEFVILGLTNGPSFTPNPCLADQLRWVDERNLMASAYSVLSYPDAATLRRYGDAGPFPGSSKLGALRNVGYAAAQYNLRTMKAAGLKTPVVWIDVEPVPVFEWSNDVVANAAVVQGQARGYTDAGYEIGFYSTPALWKRVVGDLRFGSPEWRAAGQTSKAEALSRCGEDWSFQGGRAVFGQWVEAGRDRNVTCPGVAATVERWFHQY